MKMGAGLPSRQSWYAFVESDLQGKGDTRWTGYAVIWYFGST